jgi:hypothetical protein
MVTHSRQHLKHLQCMLLLLLLLLPLLLPLLVTVVFSQMQHQCRHQAHQHVPWRPEPQLQVAREQRGCMLQLPLAEVG